MVDYSRWDRLDLSDSDSDGGEAGAGGVVAPNLPSGAVEVVDAPRVPSDAEVLEQCESLLRSLDDHRQMPLFYELLSRRFGPGVNLGPKRPFVEEWFEAILDAAEASIGSGGYANGDNYEGELKDGKPHGKGICRYADGNVYDGEWKDEKKHGSGTLTFANGDVYNGEFWNEKRQGRGYYKSAAGEIYDGEWANDMPNGKGTQKRGDGRVYEGEFVEGREHGWGTMTEPLGYVYAGQWARGTQHGKGTLKLPTGEIYEAEFKEGAVAQSKMTRGNGYTSTTPEPSAGAPIVVAAIPSKDTDPAASCEEHHERTLRSAESQQRRLQRDLTAKNCEHCGVDDGQYKLRVCSGCNLALYCSAACQKAASRSHRRICSIVSQLPPRDADRLTLIYDKDEQNDFDAGLRYATKYMEELKHLAIDLTKMERGNSEKLSVKQLTSLLKSKKGKLDSVYWMSMEYDHIAGISNNCHDVWRELHSLKQLRLEAMAFDGAQQLADVICQQRNSLEGLCLPYVRIDWSKAKNRRTIAQAVSACKQLVKLDLHGCRLMDSDLKIILHDLPDLRVLYLKRHHADTHEFTDNTCSLIARKCPRLQELDVDGHNQLSARGIRKIFDSCIQLRSFYTTTHKLCGKDIQSLLDIAPRLMFLSLDNGIDVSEVELSRIIEATGGRTILQPGGVAARAYSTRETYTLSASTRDRYENQKKRLNNIWSNRLDPLVSNEWAAQPMCPLDSVGEPAHWFVERAYVEHKLSGAAAVIKSVDGNNALLETKADKSCQSSGYRHN